jgi:serine protease Do
MNSAPARKAGAVVFAIALLALITPAAMAADGYLGVRIQDVDDALAAALDLDDVEGVLISEVMEDSPAEEAGLQRGDLVLTINGREASDSGYFTRRVRRLDAGETATLEILRKGNPMTISVTLAEVPENEFFETAPRHIRLHSGGHGDAPSVWTTRDDDVTVFGHVARLETMGRGAHLGVNVHSLDEDLGRYFGADEGVLVLGVNEDTAAEEAGLQTGDVILSVDGDPVDSTTELHEALADFEPGDEVDVAFLRDKQEKTVTVELGESRGVFMIREIDGARGMNEFHIQRAPHARPHRQYRMRLHDPEDVHEELQRLKEHLERLEGELEALEKGE